MQCKVHSPRVAGTIARTSGGSRHRFTVIPAKAGTQRLLTAAGCKSLDPRLRGDDDQEETSSRFNEDGPSMQGKPQLSFWQIWNMCFGFLGIQFGFALQNANVSRIFQTLGASMDDIPILWIAAPLTGLIVQPIVGYLSDRTWTGLGSAPPVLPGRCGARHARPDRRCRTRRRCGSPPACCGCWMPRSTSRWSRSARSSATSCRCASGLPAMRCRASSSASVRWSPACCRSCSQRSASATPPDRAKCRTPCATRSTSAARSCSRPSCGRYCARASIRRNS